MREFTPRRIFYSTLAVVAILVLGVVAGLPWALEDAYFAVRSTSAEEVQADLEQELPVGTAWIDALAALQSKDYDCFDSPITIREWDTWAIDRRAKVGSRAIYCGHPEVIKSLMSNHRINVYVVLDMEMRVERILVRADKSVL